MGFAEYEMLEYVRSNLSEFYHINVVDILDQLAGCLTISDIEGIRARLGNQGNQRSVYDLLDALRRRRNWVNELIKALRACKHTDLAESLQSKYDALQLPTGSASSNNSNQLSSSGAPSAQSPALPLSGNSPPSYGSLEFAPSHPQPLPFYRNTPPSYGSLPPTFAPARLIQQPYFSSPSTTSPPTLPSQRTPERATSIPESPTQYHSPPDRNSSSAAGPPGPSSPAPPDGALTEFKVAIAETQPDMGPSRTSSSNTATRPDANAAVGYEHSAAACPGVDAAGPSLTPRGPKKGGFESRLSQNALLARHMNEASGNVAPNFPLTPESTPVGHRAGAFATDPEPTVKRKETGLPRKRAPGERSDDHMVKVTDNISHQISTNPNAATPKSKNTFGSGVKSQIPRKAIHLPGNEPLNKTSPPATNENCAGSVLQPFPMPNNETGNRNYQNERLETRSEVNRDSGEEEEEPVSKPGVLESQESTDLKSSTRPLPAVDEGSESSSLHPSRFAFSRSTDATSRSIPNSRRPEAVEDPRHLHTFEQQEPELSSNYVSSSTFTVSDDPLMVSVSLCTTATMAPEVNEPEEDEFFSQPSAKGSSIDAAERVFCSGKDVAAKSTYPNHASEMFDDGSSLEDTRIHHLHLSNNPPVDNYSANYAVGSSPMPSSGGANSRRNEDDTKDSNRAFMHVGLPAIMFAFIGIFFLYKSRQK